MNLQVANYGLYCSDLAKLEALTAVEVKGAVIPSERPLILLKISNKTA